MVCGSLQVAASEGAGTGCYRLPRSSVGPGQHSWCVLTTSSRMCVTPEVLWAPEMWGDLSSSIALTSSLPSISSLLRPDILSPSVLMLNPPSFLHVWHPPPVSCLAESWHNSQSHSCRAGPVARHVWIEVLCQGLAPGQHCAQLADGRSIGPMPGRVQVPEAPAPVVPTPKPAHCRSQS